MLGDTAVGKSSLVSQFMTSEYLHAYDTSIGKLLSILFFELSISSHKVGHSQWMNASSPETAIKFEKHWQIVTAKLQ